MRSLFEIAEPAVEVSLFMIVFYAAQAQIPALLGSGSWWWW
jgi:hypothetical protein